MRKGDSVVVLVNESDIGLRSEPRSTASNAPRGMNTGCTFGPEQYCSTSTISKGGRETKATSVQVLARLLNSEKKLL